jgi:hypothetical protein
MIDPEEGGVVRAYVLIETDPGATAQVADAVRLVPDVQDVSVLAGPFDVLVEIDAESHNAIDLDVARIKPIVGVHWVEECDVLDLTAPQPATSSTAH